MAPRMVVAVLLAPRLTASVVGENLFKGLRTEFGGTGALVTPTRIPRSARLHLIWQF